MSHLSPRTLVDIADFLPLFQYCKYIKHPPETMGSPCPLHLVSSIFLSIYVASLFDWICFNPNSFRTCQVRVVRFNIALRNFSSSFSSSPPRWTPTTISQYQWAPLDLNHKPGTSRHRWTSTGDLPSPVGTAGPQPPDRMSDRMPEYMSNRMPEYMSDRK